MGGGVRTEAEEGTSRHEGPSGAGGPSNGGTAADDGPRGGICDVGEARAALTTDGLRGRVGSSRSIDTGQGRPERGRLTGAEVEPLSMLEAEAKAGGLTLGVLVFMRFSLPPRVRWVCS